MSTTDTPPSSHRPATSQAVGGRSDAPPATSTEVPTAPRRKVRRSRMGGIWVGIIIAAIVLILLLIFIVQNSQSVKINYLGAHGTISLAVAMLLAAVGGALIVAIPGTARIMQLRRGIRHRHQGP
jgi:putative membrane protein